MPKTLYSQSQWGVVMNPVCDLRSLPQGSTSQTQGFDPNQESQLLYGEPVEIFSEQNGWLQVEALDQPEFTHQNRWQGYPGWIKKETILPVDKLPKRNWVVCKKSVKLYTTPNPNSPNRILSIGTTLSGGEKTENGFLLIETPEGMPSWIKTNEALPFKIEETEKTKRDRIIYAAKEFLGDPYFWGGRSAYIPELENQITGIDCSGLIQLSYRVAGIEIPRDSYEQFLKSTPILKENLKEGDLIFSASKKTPQKISHVAIVLDKNTLLEAPQTGEKIRIIPFIKKVGVPISKVKEGKPVGERVLYFRTYFPPE